MKTPYRVTILGREMQVRTEAAEERVREVEALINGKIDQAEASARGDSQIAAILALLNMGEQIVENESEAARRGAAVDERVDRLLELLRDF